MAQKTTEIKSPSNTISFWIENANIPIKDLQRFEYSTLFEYFQQWLLSQYKAEQKKLTNFRSIKSFSTALKNYLIENKIEREEVDGGIKSQGQLFKDQKYKSFKMTVNQKFDQIRYLARMAARQQTFNNLFLVLGDSGVGKSHIVMDTLNNDIKEDFDYVPRVIDSAFELYRTLFENRNNLIVLDDAEEFLNDQQCVSMLKMAFDTYSTKWLSYSGPKLVSYNNQLEKKRNKFEKIINGKNVPEDLVEEANNELKKMYDVPEIFKYNGSAIFISNKYMSQIPNPILTRSKITEIDLTKEEMFEWMSSNLKNVASVIVKRFRQNNPEVLERNPNFPAETSEVVEEAFQFLKDNAEVFEKPNFRMLQNTIDWIITGDKNWKKYAFNGISMSDRTKNKGGKK